MNALPSRPAVLSYARGDMLRSCDMEISEARGVLFHNLEKRLGNAGGKETPLCTEVHQDDETATGLLDLDEIAPEERGGC